eukprot:scaffold9781_cov37-Phaeocystis_antarctica.AAC.2
MVGCWTKAIASKCMATKHAIMSMSLKKPHSLDGLASPKLSSRSVRGVGVVLAAKSSARARDSAKSSARLFIHGVRSFESRCIAALFGVALDGLPTAGVLAGERLHGVHVIHSEAHRRGRHGRRPAVT